MRRDGRVNVKQLWKLHIGVVRKLRQIKKSWKISCYMVLMKLKTLQMKIQI